MNKEEKEYAKIGIFIPDLTNGFYSEIATELSELLRKKQYLPVIFNTLNKNYIEKKYYDVVVDNNYKGCIFLGGTKFLNDVDATIPIVLIDRENLKNRNYPVITSDNEKGGAIAAQYLVDNGAKRVIVIDNSLKIRNVKRRIEGVVKVLENSKLKYEVIDFNEDLIMTLVNQGFNAIFAYSDSVAIEVLNLLSRHNVKVPKKVQVIGYDNISMSEITYPKLTTVTRQTDLLSKEAVKLLNEMITKNKLINTYIKVDDYLIVRESTK